MTLDNFKFQDLLANSIKEEPKFKAAAQCLDDIFVETNNKVKYLLIWSRIDELEESQLDEFAYMFNIDYYEGYGQADLDAKRDLIKEAIQRKWQKGTRWSIERVGEILNMPIKIVEWWENVENGTNLKPYEFDAHVDSGVKGVDPEFYQNFFLLVNELKNVRSHLRKIKAMVAWQVTTYLGDTGRYGEITKVYPPILRGTQQDYKMFIHAGGYMAISGGVYPKFSIGYLIDEEDIPILTESGKSIII
jgi:phage tail P2-like protein